MRRRNPQTKKHKTWEGDAMLVRIGRKATLYDVDGRQCVYKYPVFSSLLMRLYFRMSSGSIDDTLEEGREYSVGGKEIELDRQITKADYNSGRCFCNELGSSILAASTSTIAASTARTKSKFVLPIIRKPHEQPTGRRGIPLQPVDLTSGINAASSSTKPTQIPEKALSPTYWTANWSV